MQATIPNILMVSVFDKEKTPVRVEESRKWGKGLADLIQQEGESGPSQRNGTPILCLSLLHATPFLLSEICF